MVLLTEIEISGRIQFKQEYICRISGPPPAPPTLDPCYGPIIVLDADEDSVLVASSHCPLIATLGR